MQTRTYGDLFKLISALCGTGQQLTVPEQDQLRHFINRRFEEAFNASPVWPRYLVSSEERALALYELSGATSSTSTVVNAQYKFFGINSGSFETGGGSAKADTNIYVNTSFKVSATNSTYIYKNSSNAWVVSLISSPTGTRSSDGKISLHEAGTVQFTEADTNKNDTVEGVTTWTPRGGTDLLSVEVKNTIPYAEGGIMTSDTGKTTIGDFNRIHRKKAFLNDSSLEYDFLVDFNGANILNIANTNDTSAFVSYKKQFTPFTVTSAYYDSTVEVPGEFFNYIAHTAFADFIRMQGKNEQAAAEEGMGTMFLAQELEKIDLRSNNNTINKRFSTYVSRQSR